MIKRLWQVLYFIATALLLTTGFIFEEPFGRRRLVLLALMAAYLILLLLAIAFYGHQRFMVIGIGLMLVLLLFIEVNAKFAVNYFFHTLYIFLILFTITHLKSRIAIIVSCAITIISFVKFVQLIAINPTFANVALMVFFGSVQILVVVVALFFKVYQEETEKTKALYEELLDAHDQLKIYANEIEELTRVEARTRIARDLHDTLGHELTGLIMQMEMAGSHYEDGDREQGQAMLDASKKSARGSLAKVRQIVETLKNNEALESTKTSLEQLIKDFAGRTGIIIDFIHKGNGKLKPEKSLVLYRVVQESLTNAVRHGQATRVKVILLYGSDGLDFQIEDNGVGSDSVIYNNGLKGMAERLEEVGGKLGVDGRPVFKVWGRIPY